MSHQHLQSLALEETVQRMSEAQFMIVTVARNSYKRLEVSNFRSK
jgi:hypothetical protein